MKANFFAEKANFLLGAGFVALCVVTNKPVGNGEQTLSNECGERLLVHTKCKTYRFSAFAAAAFHTNT